MRELLTMELVLGALLVSSFTIVGIAVLWMATSPRHWFVGTAGFLTALSPLLLIPAYEPVTAFVIQGAVVAGGVAAFRRWQNRRERSRPSTSFGAATNSSSIHFSLSTLLLLTAIVAIATPIMMRFPRLNLRGWSSVVLIGAASGTVTLLAAWMFASRRKLMVWPIALVLCLLTGVALWGLDWFAYSVVKHSDWPPNPPSRIGPIVGNPPEPPVIVWPVALPTMAVVLTLILLLFFLARDRRRIVARVGVAVLLILIAAFPLSVLWKLLHPRPIPQRRLPQPNAYDDFVAAGKAFNTSPILNTTVEPTSTAQLAAEVAKYARAFDRVESALELPCEVPMMPFGTNWPFDLAFHNVQTIRGLARALNCKAELAQQQGNFRDAALISIQNMRLGVASARGGIVPHYLVGIAIEGIGQHALYQAAGHLDARSCDEAIRAMEEIDRSHEPADVLLQRDRIYCENAWGWYGHLLLMLDDIVDDHPGYWATKQAASRSTATRRLLMLELALRQYQLENGARPDRLESLVPDYVSHIPIDPYDAQHRPLRYVPTVGGFLLYSVGYDGDDDGGRPSPRDSGLLEDGDIRLDSWFAPEEQEPEPATNDPADTSIDESEIDAMDRTDEQ
jgi:hypothetical protein